MAHDDTPTATSDRYVVPDELTERDIWVLWDGEEKVPLAPWTTGHMYRAAWGADVDSERRPETSYEKAKMLADLSPSAIHDSYPFPRADDGTPEIPDRIIPTIVLPHVPTSERVLMIIDFDDVRDPETGAITPEVQRLLDRIDAYTEISWSGKGLHCYVYARLPTGLGKFNCPLDDIGGIEMYDHGRFCASTWRHVEGSPLDIPECQDLVDELIREFEDDAHRRRRLKGEQRVAGGRDDDDLRRTQAKIRGDRGSSSDNAYYRVDITDVADTGPFRSHRQRWRGPHPEHGGTTSPDSESNNFSVNPDDNCWYCFAHDVGGGPLQLVAVLEGVRGCADTSQLEGRDLLRTCLAARDRYASGLQDEDPPYEALVTVAELCDLVMADEDAGILGPDTYRMARIVYDDLDTSDV